MAGAPKQTECRSRLPAGLLDHREFIRRVGTRIDRDWTDREHLALLPARERADLLAAVDQMSADEAAAIFDDQHGADGESVATGPPTAICLLCDAPADTIKDGKDYCSEHAKQVGPKPIPGELRHRAVTPAPTDGPQTNQPQIAQIDDEKAKEWLAEAGREILRQRIMDQGSPEAEPRRRWNFVYAVVRDAVFAGKIRPAAFCLDETSYPSVGEWRPHYPGPRELRVNLPSLPLPAWIAFDEADVDAVAEMMGADPPLSESVAGDTAVTDREALEPENSRPPMTKDETDAAIGEFIRGQSRVTEDMLRKHFPGLTRGRIRQARRKVETPRRGRPKKSPG